MMSRRAFPSFFAKFRQDEIQHAGDASAAGATMMWGEVFGHAVRVRHLSLWLGCG